jgi:hypothetical protein
MPSMGPISVCKDRVYASGDQAQMAQRAAHTIIKETWRYVCGFKGGKKRPPHTQGTFQAAHDTQIDGKGRTEEQVVGGGREGEKGDGVFPLYIPHVSCKGACGIATWYCSKGLTKGHYTTKTILETNPNKLLGGKQRPRRSNTLGAHDIRETKEDGHKPLCKHRNLRFANSKMSQSCKHERLESTKTDSRLPGEGSTGKNVHQ